MEAFLNKILSDAKKQSAVETQLLEDKSEVLDAMYETVEAANKILAQVKDLMCNVRADVKEIQPLTDSKEKTKAEITSPNLCLSCGKPLLPEFKICPYCGENTKLLPEKTIPLKDYR